MRRLLQLVVKTVRGGLPRNFFSKKDFMALPQPVAASYETRGLDLSKYLWAWKVVVEELAEEVVPHLPDSLPVQTCFVVLI